MLREKTLLLGAVVALLALPANAFAAQVFVHHGVAEYTADLGETNDLQISLSAGVATFTDSGAVVTAGDGCQQVDDHHVTCGPALVEVDTVAAFLSDGDDIAVVSEAPLQI
jgi:hypothetical protein